MEKRGVAPIMHRARNTMSSSRPIRVVVIQPALPKYRVPVFRELARRPGIDLTFLYSTIPNLPNVEPDGFRAMHVPLYIRHFCGEPIWCQPAQWQYASRRTTDVLVIEWDIHQVLLVPALLRAHIEGVPTVLWGHGYSKHEKHCRKTLRDLVANLGTCLLFYNRTTAQKFLDAGWPRQRIYVALNSLDQAPIQAAARHWRQSPAALREFQRQHGLAGRAVVLFVSRLEADNRVDMLLQATRMLAEDRVDLVTVVVGKGPDEQRLRKMSEDLGISQRVVFTGAIYDEMALAPWFLSARVFCYPTNIGLSILHAMGYGLPVITSDRMDAQNPEIEALRPGYNGLVYRHGDARALADALLRIIRDDALAQRLSEGAYRTIAEDFNLPKMVDGIEAAVRYAWSRRG